MVTAGLSTGTMGNTGASHATPAHLGAMADTYTPTLSNLGSVATDTGADCDPLSHISARTSTCDPGWANPNVSRAAQHVAATYRFCPGTFPT
ncbi:MAG: hypothetical protein RMK79_04755 [Anaerolineae bacterium]|nr:hypothetical protein [Anaerolineae bacterium]